MTEETEAQLLDSARRGDNQAIEELLLRHQAQIYRFGLRMCRDPEDAQDIAQETLLTLARNVSDFRGASSLSTWLYTVARSYCIKKRRKSASRPEEIALVPHEGGDTSAWIDPARTPDELLAHKQLENALSRAIDALAPSYREVLILRDVEGLTANEVAEVLLLSPQAVKSRLHRARLSVREALASWLELSTTGRSPGCPDVVTLFSRHLEGEISSHSCAEMERHLENCEDCRNNCASLQKLLALCRTTGEETEVPEAVQSAIRRALNLPPLARERSPQS